MIRADRFRRKNAAQFERSIGSLPPPPTNRKINRDGASLMFHICSPVDVSYPRTVFISRQTYGHSSRPRTRSSCATERNDLIDFGTRRAHYVGNWRAFIDNAREQQSETRPEIRTRTRVAEKTTDRALSVKAVFE